MSISRKDPTLQSSCIIQYNFSSEDDDAYPGPSLLQSVACHESSTEQCLTNNSTSTSVIPKLVTLTLSPPGHVGKLKYTFPSTQYNSL